MRLGEKRGPRTHLPHRGGISGGGGEPPSLQKEKRGVVPRTGGDVGKGGQGNHKTRSPQGEGGHLHRKKGSPAQKKGVLTKKKHVRG